MMTHTPREHAPSAIAGMMDDMGIPIPSLVIALTAFLTLIDLFGTQAILPALVAHYHVTRAAMGVAVNASTLGMALSGLFIAMFGSGIGRRTGTLVSLLCLSVPTALLASAPNLAVFAALRVVQGLFMASAFALTLSYLAENACARQAASASAAYITGNVASNLAGRLMAAGLADTFGLATNFYVFSALNLAGAVLVFFAMRRTRPMTAGLNEPGMRPMHRWDALLLHLSHPEMRAAFGLGFLILFAFIGTYTYVNFVLVRPPLNLSMMSLGIVYFVFLPAMVTTPVAGRIAQRIGARTAIWLGLGVALAGLPLLISVSLTLVLTGLVLVGVGTFFAQAAATGFVSRAAKADRTAANGLYLASYFFGGLAGAAVLGQLFDGFGWTACVAGVGACLLLAAGLTVFLIPSD